MADNTKKRIAVQGLWSLITNANFKGFFEGKIYSGPVKQICVPGLNCYSCPGAVGACPIGSLQTFLSKMTFKFPYYVLGLLIFFGAILGRVVCGFLCPFGLLQELLALIPFPVKKNRFKADRPMRCIKYIILLLCVVILPTFIKLTPVFCKYICPSGTVSGILLAISNSGIAGRLGRLFTWKLIILLAIVISSLIIFRPFCKYLCPLGAFYALFNRFALVRLYCDTSKCISCGKCSSVCKMCVDPTLTPDSGECIRCGDCVKACPEGALRCGISVMDRITPEKNGRDPFAL